MRRCEHRGLVRGVARTTRFLGISVLSMVLVTTAACTVQGRAVPDFPDPAALDTGPYTTDPLPEQPPRSPDAGRLAESVRMAEMIALPRDVEPALSRSFGGGVIPLPTPVKVSALLAAPVVEVLRRYEMLAGAALNGVDNDPGVEPRTGVDRFLEIMVFRFPDDTAAQRAAAEIDAEDAAVNRDNVAVPIANYPAAHAHWRPGVPTPKRHWRASRP